MIVGWDEALGKDLRGRKSGYGSSGIDSGCTAVVTLLKYHRTTKDLTVFCANLGDSRAALDDFDRGDEVFSAK